MQINVTFGVSLAAYADGWYKRDVPKLLKDLCMPQIKDADKRECIIKQRINGTITKKLTKLDLERIDAWEEVEMWFKKSEALSTEHSSVLLQKQ